MRDPSRPERTTRRPRPDESTVRWKPVRRRRRSLVLNRVEQSLLDGPEAAEGLLEVLGDLLEPEADAANAVAAGLAQGPFLLYSATPVHFLDGIASKANRPFLACVACPTTFGPEIAICSGAVPSSGRRQILLPPVLEECISRQSSCGSANTP